MLHERRGAPHAHVCEPSPDLGQLDRGHQILDRLEQLVTADDTEPSSGAGAVDLALVDLTADLGGLFDTLQRQDRGEPAATAGQGFL
jgi:hypothetical protein